MILRLVNWFWLLLTAPLWLLGLARGPHFYRIVRVEISSPIPEIGRVRGAARFFRKPRLGLWDLFELFRAAKRDRRVRGIHLAFEGPFTDGTATAQTLARIVADAVKGGVKVLVTTDHLDSRLLMVASQASKIAMPPAAPVFVPGHATEVAFLRDFLDTIGVRAQFHRIGEYKTAADLFDKSDLSPEHREMLESLLGDLQEQFVTLVAQGRGMPREKAATVVERAYLDSQEALEEKLIDRLLYPDQIDDWLKEETGGPVRTVDAWAYLRRTRLRRSCAGRLRGPRPRIAVICLEGVIVSERARRLSPSGMVSAATLQDSFRAVKRAGSIRAAILRVDSPGGSGSESELLWREVSTLAQAKPVVVSLGDVGASGGYYLAAGANRILASAGTLTGSIGVLAGKFEVSRALDRLGIRVIQLAHSSAAGIFSPTRPFSDGQADSIHRQIERFYALFLQRVAEGRRMETAAVDQVARGRVWTGRQAQAAGLVDQTGGLSDVIGVAKELAGIDPSREVDIQFFLPARPFVGLPFGAAARAGLLLEQAARMGALAETGVGPLALLPYLGLSSE